MRRLNRADSGFDAELEKLLAWEGVSNDQVNQTVREILSEIRSRGDAALLEYTNRFDRMSASTMDELTLPQERLQQALDNLPEDQGKALELSAERVRLYHEHQKNGVVELHRSRWHHAGAAGDTTGSCGALCAWRQGGLPLFRIDERHSCQGGRGRRADYGGAHPRWRGQ